MVELLKNNPDFFPLVSSELNDRALLEKISCGSSKTIWWTCELDHTWLASPYSRIKSNTGCPYCKGTKVLAGFNDLATTHPDIANKWDYELNTDIKPEDISIGTKKKIWWKCENGHSYLKEPKFISYGQKCTYCYGKKTLKGFNDLATTNPELLDYWDYEKNTISPEEVSKGSDRKVWWKCENNHSYKKMISDRIVGRSCKYCYNREVIPGENDLNSTHPDLLKYWDYDKNIDIKPEDVTYGSGKKVWWKCEQNHSYYANIYDRSAGKMCSRCVNFISKSEDELADWLKEIIPHDMLRNSRKIIPPQELDIFIPDKKIAIEFNGVYWHTEKHGKDKKYHYNKFLECQKQGIQLITIWEDDWLDKKHIIKNMLTHKLHLNDDVRIFARKTMLKEIIVEEAKVFTNQHHIQQFAKGSLYLGLYGKVNDNDELVAVSIWKKQGQKLYLERYCTNYNVIGGLGKMLKHAQQWAHAHSLNQIVTFSDNEVSDGGLYEKLGFVRDKELSPDYKYLYGGKKCHKFNFRIERFKNNSNLIYEPNLTESELARLNGLERIWDSGKTRWVINLDLT